MLNNKEKTFLEEVKEGLKYTKKTFLNDQAKIEEFLRAKYEQVQKFDSSELILEYCKLTEQEEIIFLDNLLEMGGVKAVCEAYKNIHKYRCGIYKDFMKYAKQGNQKFGAKAEQLETELLEDNMEIANFIVDRANSDSPLSKDEIDEVIGLILELDKFEKAKHDISKFYLKSERKYLYGEEPKLSEAGNFLSEKVVAQFGTIQQNKKMLKRIALVEPRLLRDCKNPNAEAIYSNGTPNDIYDMVKSFRLHMNPTYYSWKILNQGDIDVNIKYASLNSDGELEHYNYCLSKTSDPNYDRQVKRIKRILERELSDREKQGLSKEDETVYKNYGIKTFTAFRDGK